MPLLLLASLIWAFSPGLTKGLVTGLDSSLVAAVRLWLAFLVFLPLFRPRGLDARAALTLAAIGAVEFGLMYLAYNASFRLLASHEVALLTLTTPVFVTLLADATERTFRPAALLAAAIAVAGTAIVVFSGKPLRPTLAGVVLVQASNLAFAAGQVAYRRFRRARPALRDHHVFALPYAGAAVVATLALLFRDVPIALRGPQVATLAYLGVIASGAGFFLWNAGATRVNAGLLAVMNNAKIPLMVACSILVFGEQTDWLRLLASAGLLVLAVWLAGRRPRDA